MTKPWIFWDFLLGKHADFMIRVLIQANDSYSQNRACDLLLTKTNQPKEKNKRIKLKGQAGK